MKKLHLLLVTLLFSSLLIGCGMKGPLYHAPETKNLETQETTPKEDKNIDVVEDEGSTSN